MRSFEWLVALRYLRLRSPRSAKLYRLPLGLAFGLGAVWLFTSLLNHSHSPRLADLQFAWHGRLLLAKLLLMVLLVLVGAFILLIRRLTIFSTISTYGLFLGSATLVIVLSVMSGFEADLKSKILGTNSHVIVTSPNRPFSDYAQLAARLALPTVVGVTPYLASEVIIASSSNSDGVVLKGIDPATIGRATDLERNIDAGGLDLLSHPDKLAEIDPLADDDLGIEGAANKEAPKAPPRRLLPGIIIGRELAKNLHLSLGDDVNVISPFGGIGPEGPIPKSKPFRVAGIFYSGLNEYDSKNVYMALPAAQRFLGQEGEVTGLELKVADPDHTESVVAAVRRALGPDFEVDDWKTLNHSLFGALKLEKILMFVLLCFIVLVAAFSIIANGIMLIMERRSEIAILKSMGSSDRSVLVIFIVLGLFMGGLGTLVGVTVGVLTCLALGRWGLPLDPEVFYITKVPIQMNPYEIAAVFGAALLITVLAALYPAWSAARLQPVEGLREDSL